MTAQATAAVFVIVVWWASTGAVLGLVWLRESTHRLSLAAFTALAIAGVAGAWWASDVTSPGAAYVAFVSALAIWAWHELTFLLGYITGPRKVAITPGASGWDRFRQATATVIHHEIALAATAALLFAVSWGAPNPVAAWTFAALWVMRLSAKLNLFLGVRSVTEEFVPARLRYLLSYFRRARLNPLMPLSLVGATGVTVAFAVASARSDATPFEVVASTLVGTLLALALIEHLFLALPLREALLWRWILPSKRSEEEHRVA